MIILRHGRFISGFHVYKAGEILPDTPGANNLAKMGMAEIVADAPKKPPKPVKKSDNVPAPVEAVPENAKVNP